MRFQNTVDEETLKVSRKGKNIFLKKGKNVNGRRLLYSNTGNSETREEKMPSKFLVTFISNLEINIHETINEVRR